MRLIRAGLAHGVALAARLTFGFSAQAANVEGRALAPGSTGTGSPAACGVNEHVDDNFQWWEDHKKADEGLTGWRAFESAVGAPDPACGAEINSKAEDQFRWWLDHKRVDESWASWR